MDDREQQKLIDKGTDSYIKGLNNVRRIIAEIEGTNGRTIEASESPIQIRQQSLSPRVVPVEIAATKITTVSTIEKSVLPEAVSAVQPDLAPRNSSGDHSVSLTGKLLVIERAKRKAA